MGFWFVGVVMLLLGFIGVVYHHSKMGQLKNENQTLLGK